MDILVALIRERLSFQNTAIAIEWIHPQNNGQPFYDLV